MPDITDPKKPSLLISKSLAISLLITLLLLLVAIGLAVWIFVQRHSSVADSMADIAQPTDETRNVKNATWYTPSTLPANYKLNDQTTNTVAQKYYYDDASNCGITTIITNKSTTETVEDVIIGVIADTEAEGVTTVSSNEGQEIELADYDDPSKTYTFNSVEFEQQVSVPGIAYTAQSNVTFYRQFGAKVASLSYSCRADTWDTFKEELLGQVKAFTIKTEE